MDLMDLAKRVVATRIVRESHFLFNLHLSRPFSGAPREPQSEETD